MKLKAIIVEDEANSREILRNYLNKYCSDVEIMGEAATIKEGLNLINSNKPDLVFLDVEMPFGNAFDLLDELPERNFEIIFVTAYNHYAIDALNNHAAYYLMKPINIDELVKGVAYVKEIREKEANLENKVLKPKIAKPEGKITIPLQSGFQVLNIDEILFCKADDNYTEIYLGERKIVVSKTLKYFEEALPDQSFTRIHKSYLVNINEVVKYKKGKGGSVILSNGKELSVSATKKALLLSFFK
ncbi:LytR/AlgR family response regulator transcription factor [Croceivirga thetidis]|uniref:Response regulator transcription factor n=1 Tax=Croceivirga thetidis TaxID=2721623 RepID=A0ABX1GL61_9FLAO|nr:LytTR family DNA-binding domain-containing protein [Croceivirga thetidis]NKI30598.1 response regulator transcription factor [Croceivirga thetidis]